MSNITTSTEALARMSKIGDDIDAITKAASGREFTPAENDRFEALCVELNARQHEYLGLEREEREIRQGRLQESRAKYKTVQVGSTSGRETPTDLVRAGAREIRDGVMRSMESRDARHLTAEQREHVESLIDSQTENVQGDKLGRYILAADTPAYRSAWQKYVSEGTPVFSPEESVAVGNVRAAQRAMSIGTPSAGGFAVPSLIDPSVFVTSGGSEDDILSLSNVKQITTDKWIGLSAGHVSWTWQAEAAEVTDNSPTLAQPEVPVHRADGFVPFSIEVGMDWPNFAADMSVLLATGFQELVIEGLTVGTNTNGPAGLVPSLDALTSPANLVVTTAGTLGAGDLYNLYANLPAKARKNATFMSSLSVQNSARALGNSGDASFTVDLTADGIPKLFGKRYVTSSYMDAMPTGTGNQPLLVLGDFKGYVTAIRAGMSVELVPHLFHTNANRPSGTRGFFAHARIGGGLADPGAFRILLNKAS